MKINIDAKTTYIASSSKVHLSRPPLFPAFLLLALALLEDDLRGGDWSFAGNAVDGTGWFFNEHNKKNYIYRCQHSLAFMRTNKYRQH